MGKGEIARYEQVLFFPQCFQKAYFPGASKGFIVWEWVKGKLTLVQATSWDVAKAHEVAELITRFCSS